MTRLLSLDPADPDAAAIAEAAALLRAGGLVVFPTETVYGLGANALDAAAVARIFVAKGRPATNPLIVHVADAEMARQVAAEWPDAAERLARACWPGPLTLVLPRRPGLPLSVTAGLPAVGVRVPAHPVALALIRAAGCPIAAPSANPYMGVSPTTAAHVATGLAGKVDLILDGGPANVGLESTVLDLTSHVPRVLRLGGTSLARLRDLLGEVGFSPRVAAEDEARPSPGLARRHYAPTARLHLLANADEVAAKAAQLLAQGHGAVGAWVQGPVATMPAGLALEVMPSEPGAYAARLYAALHDADARGLSDLLVALPPADEAWAAVHDRLRRAATA